MKKTLLFLMAIIACVLTAQAQRLVLYEEFSGENCGRCAQYNPLLSGLLSANTSKVVRLQYQTNIPNPGPIYAQNAAEVQARIAYYGVDSVPSGTPDGRDLNGAAPGQASITAFTQTEINTAYGTPASFTMTVSHTWSSDGDSIYATVNVTSTSAFAPAGANMKLRAALVEHLQFQSPPGGNGETNFPNVMRKMYPGAAGQPVPNVWNASQTATYGIAGPVPPYIDKQNEVFLIVWLQNDADKKVAQTAKSAFVTIPLDAASVGVSTQTKLLCGVQTATAVPAVILKNAGTTAITSATIYYKVDNGAFQTQPWSGNLAPAATVSVNLPAQPLAVGSHFITDSVTNPNSSPDINGGNGSSSVYVSVHDNSPNNLPIATGFEGTGQLPVNWILQDDNSNGKNWVLLNSTNQGHLGTKYMLMHRNFEYSAGEKNYAILPQPNLGGAGPEALDFWIAYAQYTSENDKLEIVYSSDCGQSWSTIWSEEGASLATSPPVADNVQYFPAASEWRKLSVDLAPVPQGAMIAIRATSAFGNNLFLDDVNLRSGSSTGLENIDADRAVTAYPNPANGAVNVSLMLEQAARIEGVLLDLTGRVVSSFANGSYGAGRQTFIMNTAALPNGIYTLKTEVDGTILTRRISILH